MKLFKSTVEKLIKNSIDVEDACAKLRFWANTHPKDATAYKTATSYLSSLYAEHKIGESTHKKLLKAIQLAAPDNLSSIDDEDDEDETVIAASLKKDAEEKEDITIQLPDDNDEDATVLASHVNDFSIPEHQTTAHITEDDDDEDSDILKAGSILKDRFNLVSVLGEGGMGVVYKAIDMLKVEAKDMNPYVAIKVLSEDFKEHPDAFISLQRETSKAQKLAHPNIATVYDFDRDKETIYMTMELLEGKPLDDFIKSMPKGGLSEEEALEIVTGLGEGLSYAHENGLVHSDFKPGNAFVLYDGPVKVIDFGIARAAGGAAQDPAPDHDINKTGLETDLNPAPTDNTAGTTDFDAGTLGALTPAYATVEMFEGKEPAPSDDIYALACVAVQLLTGKHPFKKKTAPKAREQKLRPPVINGFTKRQQRALEKALEFTRDKRTETMAEFLDGVRRRKNYTKQIVFGTLVTIGLIGGLGYKPVTNYYEQKEIDQIIQTANAGTNTRLVQTLSSLYIYPASKQNAIKTGVKDKAIGLFSSRIKQAVSTENNQYEFSKAEMQIKEALSYYPDSAEIRELSTKIANTKKEYISGLRESYLTQLLAKNFYPDDNKDDLTDILMPLSRVSPADETFSDPRLEFGYYKAAVKSLSENNFKHAMTYIGIGQQYVTDSAIYGNMQDKINIQRVSSQLLSKQKNIENSITGADKNLEGYETNIDELTILSLPSSHKSRYYNNFLAFFESAFSKMENSNPQLADELINTFSTALTTRKIISYNERLPGIPGLKNKKLTGELPDVNFLNKDTDLKTLVNHISDIRSNVAEYKNDALTQYNLSISNAIKPIASGKRPELVAFYSKLYSGLLIQDTTETLDEYWANANDSYASSLRRIELLASAENDKRIFRNIASENRLKDSIKIFNKISRTSKDVEFLEFAKSEISRMYATLAESNATEGDFVTALDYIVQAKEFGATERMNKQEYNYRKEILVEETVALVVATDEETEERLMSEDNRQLALNNLKLLKKNYVDDYPFIIDKISDKINNELIVYSSVNLIDSHKLKEYALTVINTRAINNVKIKPLPQPSKLALRGKIEVSQYNLSAAQATLAEALETQPDHYQVKEFQDILDEQLVLAKDKYTVYKKHFDAEQYNKADTALNVALKNWKDNPEFLKERDYFNRAMQQINAGGKLCRNDLQGIGKQTRGTCNDVALSIDRPTPTMVVVPATSAQSQPYAIGKYEISTGQLNDYCKSTGDCSTVSTQARSLPAVNVPSQIIESYTNWLSKETGFTYKVASYKQWINAASAGGREGNSDYNCRLRLGKNLIKGQNIVPVESGSANNWGLINYVGNADEIVLKDNKYTLVGGNFSDSISDCKITLEKSLSADASVSGFRLVRQLD